MIILTPYTLRGYSIYPKDVHNHGSQIRHMADNYGVFTRCFWRAAVAHGVESVSYLMIITLIRNGSPKRDVIRPSFFFSLFFFYIRYEIREKDENYG